MPTTEQIAAAIKAAKWVKGDYAYALHEMLPYNHWDAFKKEEVISRFYEAIKTKWRHIEHFTDFKNIK